MIRCLIIFSTFLATSLAQAQPAQVTYSTDCVSAKVRCNGPTNSSVLEGLKQPDGSDARYHAEICKLLPAVDQGPCMAQWRDEAKRAPEIPEVRNRNVPPPVENIVPQVESDTSAVAQCDFRGPQSLGKIHSALKRCASVTVTANGKSLRYATARTARAPVTAPTSQGPNPNVTDIKAQIATMLWVTEVAQFGKVYTKTTRGVYAVCGYVSGRNAYGHVSEEMKFIAVNGVAFLIMDDERNAEGRAAFYNYCVN